MLFNSFSYAIFLPLVFLIYWFFSNNQKSQNLILLLFSYTFYAFWDWRFLSLLLFSTTFDYFSGLKIQNSKTKKIKTIWVWSSISINILFLCVFKYFNFFIDSFISLLAILRIKQEPYFIQLILPVGISFYTFHGLSYVIDLSKKKIEAEKDIVTYGLFVNFFPLLIAGPIERATHLLPQLKIKRIFNEELAFDGMKMILWGLVKKVVIADQCAIYVNLIFENPNNFNSASLLFGALLFSVQIYGDFSGYTDIAIGSAKLLGLNLLNNFNYPYFSKNIKEFWSRWHMSLTSWFKDYLYIPLGGNKKGKLNAVKNTLIVFLVSGLWHGANWTFVIWGLFNGIFTIPYIFKKNIFFKETTNQVLSIFFTFFLTTFCWILFRSISIEYAYKYYIGILKFNFLKDDFHYPNGTIILILIFFLIEWYGKNTHQITIKRIFKYNQSLRWLFYSVLILLILTYSGQKQAFIYFQF